MANGTIDLECGNTTNNASGPTAGLVTPTRIFLTASRFRLEVESKIVSISDSRQDDRLSGRLDYINAERSNSIQINLV